MDNEKVLSIKSIKNKIATLPPVLYLLVALIVFFSLTAAGYLDLNNLENILMQSSVLMILAFGQTLVILTQGADLSLGAQVSVVTVIWIYLARLGVPLIVGAVISVCFTVLVGMVNGLLVSKGKMPAFIATFGMQSVLYSIALVMTSGSSIIYKDYTFRYISESTFLGINIPVYIAVAAFALTWVLLNRTKFGMNIFGLGGNPEALFLAGVNTTKCYIKTYAYCGFMAGIAGLLTACRVESGQPVVGTGMEFEAVAAVLLGGTSMREGKGSVTSTIFGVLLLGIIRNGLNISGVSAVYQSAIIGTVLLAAIVIDATVRRFRRD